MAITTNSAQTLGELRQRCIDETDEGSDPNGFIDTDNWNAWINSAISYLFRLLADKFGQNWYYESVTVTGVQGQNSYPLPDGTLYSAAPACWKIIGVDIALDGNGTNWVNALPYQIKQRNMYSGFYFPIAVVSPWLARYQLQKNNINWIPGNTAPGPTLFRINYIPKPPVLTDDDDAFDGIAGWEELVVIEASLRALAKKETDATVMLQRRQDWMQRVEDEADSRDAAEPLRMVDCGGAGSWAGMGGGGLFGGGGYG